VRGLVNVKLDNGSYFSVKLSDCNKAMVYIDPDETMFARIPKPDAKPGDEAFDYVKTSPEALRTLIARPPSLVTRRPPPRNRGLTAACLRVIQDAFHDHWSDPAPTLRQLQERCGCRSRNPGYDAYELFYDSDEYRLYRAIGGASWGPGRRAKPK
jgi:hypothetical protein